MKKLFILLVTILMNSCATNSEWTALFDGQTVKGLRGYRDKGMPDSWEVLDGTLKTKPIGGNSGVFYFATEEGDHIWETAPEMQVLDNNVHIDGQTTLTSAGALYALIPPSKSVVKPVGEFNQVRIKVYNNEVEHWLNGTKIVEYTYGSDEMWSLVAKSKFNSMPELRRVI